MEKWQGVGNRDSDVSLYAVPQEGHHCSRKEIEKETKVNESGKRMTEKIEGGKEEGNVKKNISNKAI
jgi:hypothetical protein